MVILSAFLALISLWALSSLLTCRVTLIGLIKLKPKSTNQKLKTWVLFLPNLERM